MSKRRMTTTTREQPVHACDDGRGPGWCEACELERIEERGQRHTIAADEVPPPEAIERESIGKVRCKVDEYGYRIDGQFYRRVTTLLGGIPKDWLPRWKINMAAKRLLEHLSEDPDAIPRNQRDLANWLDKASDEYRDDRGDRGSAVHAAIEGVVRGKPVPDWADEDQAACANAVTEYLRARRAKPLGTEITVYSPTEGYAGTFDYWDVTGDTEYALHDWKTSKAVYADQALQVTMYRHAEYAVVRRTPVPGRANQWEGTVIPWRRAYARRLLVHHVTPEGVKSHEVDPALDDYLWRTCRASAWTKEWLRRTNGYRRIPELSVFVEPGQDLEELLRRSVNRQEVA
ncbi:hypothetical protein [Candidatus Palauibacter sp.]|uniref:hypothetical protein n=2 Tax=Candidatus Palauibacter sp. TaxID=3101350 RepID=UPI003CC58735